MNTQVLQILGQSGGLEGVVHVGPRGRCDFILMEMMMSEEMQDIGVHRAAGLAGQLNIETAGATGLWLGNSMTKAAG